MWFGRCCLMLRVSVLFPAVLICRVFVNDILPVFVRST